MLNAIILPAQVSQPQRLLVALHGWGANAHDLAGLAPYLNLPEYQLFFPDAPFPHPYAPMGKMWYGFPENYSFQCDPAFQTKPDLIESRTLLIDWLRSLEGSTGIPLSQTILAGFSQGGAMTLDVGLRLPLAALLVLSGYLHAPVEADASYRPPVLLVHGIYDTVVPISAARQARDRLIALNIPVDYNEFIMGHEIQLPILEIMQSFMGERGV